MLFYRVSWHTEQILYYTSNRSLQQIVPLSPFEQLFTIMALAKRSIPTVFCKYIHDTIRAILFYSNIPVRSASFASAAVRCGLSRRR